MNPSLYLLIGFFSVGTPLNLYAFYRLHCGRENRLQTRRRRLFVTLQKQLNLTDLLMMLIYIPTNVFFILFPLELLTLNASFYTFLHNLIFQLVSNSLIGIAVDRFFVIRKLDEASPQFSLLNRAQNGISAKIIIAIIWISAILLSLPVLFLPDSQISNSALSEANGIENISLNEIPFHSFFIPFTDTNEAEIPPWINFIEQAYYALHLATMFWIPALIITICYGSIAVILRRIKKRKQRCLLRNARSNTKIHFKCWSSRQAALLIIVYFLCWTPYQLVTFNVPVFDSLFILHHLNIANSVINPIIYGFTRNGPPLFIVKSVRKLNNQVELKAISTENGENISSLCIDFTGPIRYEARSIDERLEPSVTLAEATFP